MSESGSRYERSFPGMVGAMIVTLAVIGVFVAFRAVNRDNPEVQRDAIDYLPAVADFQKGAPFKVAYPPELPEDWRVTDIGFDDNVGLTWSMDLLTDDGEYVAIRQAQGSETALVDEYVDEQPIPGDDLRLGGPLTESWESLRDASGDYAVLAEVGRTWLLVLGTGDDDEIEEFAASLVTTPAG